MDNRKVAILTGDFGAQHAQQPLQVLKTFGYEVDYVSPGKKKGDTVEIVFHWEEEGEQTYRESDGRTIVIREDFENVTAHDYDGLIIPGARAPEYLCTDERAVELVREFKQVNKPIVAVCHGPLLLAGAQVVDGVQVTAYPLVKPWLEMAGGEWVSPTYGDRASHGEAGEHMSGIVSDQNIITAPLKVEFPNVLRELIRLMEGADEITVKLDDDNNLLNVNAIKQK